MTTARRSMLKAVAAAPLAWSQEHQAAAAQHPSAIILSCADSRVPPEVLLDQGIGDLFTVRVAIEYAVERFGCPLCVVLGHDECGAVAAVVNHDKVPESIQHPVKHISETVEKTGALKIAGAGLPSDRRPGLVARNLSGGGFDDNQRYTSCRWPALKPPSTGSAIPVIQDASSDNRNSTAFAISSGSPMRPNGCIASILAFRSGLSNSAFVSPVRAKPGQMQLTRMPCGA